MKKITLLLVYLVVCLATSAQNKIVRGKIVDDQWAPVANASVTLPGNFVGVSTLVDGSFELSVPDNAETLRITSVGFAQQDIPITGSTLNITLSQADQELEEVVVTALGQTSKKAKVGYATNTFNSEEINRTARVSAFDGLAGKIAGAEITNTGGPGSSTKIVLRGYGVIAGGSNQPLYVIDGVPLSNARSGSGTNSVAAGLGTANGAITLTSNNDFETVGMI